MFSLGIFQYLKMYCKHIYDLHSLLFISFLKQPRAILGNEEIFLWMTLYDFEHCNNLCLLTIFLDTVCLFFPLQVFHLNSGSLRDVKACTWTLDFSIMCLPCTAGPVPEFSRYREEQIVSNQIITSYLMMNCLGWNLNIPF